LKRRSMPDITDTIAANETQLRQLRVARELRRCAGMKNAVALIAWRLSLDPDVVQADAVAILGASWGTDLPSRSLPSQAPLGPSQATGVDF
jgi:hypothetical protein